MFYGPSTRRTTCGSAALADRILKGARRANCGRAANQIRADHHLKTAKALGMTIPESFLLRAD